MSHIPPSSPTVNTPRSAQPEKLSGADYQLRERLALRLAFCLVKGYRFPVCYLGRAKTARATGRSERTISRSLSNLVATGYFTRGRQQVIRRGVWGGLPVLPGSKIWAELRRLAGSITARLGGTSYPATRGTNTAPQGSLSIKRVKKVGKRRPERPPDKPFQVSAAGFQAVFDAIGAGTIPRRLGNTKG